MKTLVLLLLCSLQLLTAGPVVYDTIFAGSAYSSTLGGYPTIDESGPYTSGGTRTSVVFEDVSIGPEYAGRKLISWQVGVRNPLAYSVPAWIAIYFYTVDPVDGLPGQMFDGLLLGTDIDPNVWAAGFLVNPNLQFQLPERFWVGLTFMKRDPTTPDSDLNALRYRMWSDAPTVGGTTLNQLALGTGADAADVVLLSATSGNLGLTLTVADVPEPSTAMLAGMSLACSAAGLYLRRRSGR